MAKIHELKCWPDFFLAILEGEKTAEYRKNDRGFQVGDYLLFHMWDPDAQKGMGLRCLCKVTHMMTSQGWICIPEDYVVMSIVRIPQSDIDRSTNIGQ